VVADEAPEIRILLRLGAELTIKSRGTRTQFLRRLRKNLRAAGQHPVARGREALDGRPYVACFEPRTLWPVHAQPAELLAVPAREDELGPGDSAGAGGEVPGKALPELSPERGYGVL